MKKLFYIIMALAFVCAGCAKNESYTGITDDTYFIKVFNGSVTDITLIIQTSVHPRRTVVIPKTSEKEISVQAAAGEYVTFSVTKIGAEYRITDSKGATIAHYTNLPSSADGMAQLDFIAFASADPDKDPIRYKTGLAKNAGENLVGKPYLLRERYFLRDGIRTDNTLSQEACSFDDEYIFQPQRPEFGNFNPDRMILTAAINAAKSTCTYNTDVIIPSGISVFSNDSPTVSFPVWDRLATDGPPSAMIYRQLTIDSINANGLMTLHRQINNQKEVFVYGPK